MKRIGILGYGIVGKSVITFLKKTEPFKDASLYLWDRRALTISEETALAQAGIHYPAKTLNLEEFITTCDLIIPSPGIAVPPHLLYTCTTELDLFCAHYNKKIIGITGTIGKTTVTFLAAHLLSQKSERFISAGNIGQAMLDVCTNTQISEQQETGVVLELSSFQLEHVQQAHCDSAVITNCYHNHLDRHGTFEAYLQAKLRLLSCVKPSGSIIISASLLAYTQTKTSLRALFSNPHHPQLIITQDNNKIIVSKLLENITSTYELVTFDRAHYSHDSITIETIKNNTCVSRQVIIKRDVLPTLTFEANSLQLIALLWAHGLSVQEIAARLATLHPILLNQHHDHRIALCHTYNNIDVYNDSKATVIQATMAALMQLSQKNRHIKLILGGFDKGVDRTPLIKEISSYGPILTTYYFGERKAIFDQEQYHWYPTLETVVQAVTHDAQPKDIILFSPSGSSHDLFKDYKQRGNLFVELIKRYGVCLV